MAADTILEDAFATNCHVGPEFVPCDPTELIALLAHLERQDPVLQPRRFPRGTHLPDGRLDLCKQAIGPLGTEAVTAAARGNPHVRHLLLGADGIGDRGARAVAELARASRQLETVYLGCNFISQEGVAWLAEALAAHPGVRALWLKRNPLGEEGVRHIADLLQVNSTLRTLDLVNTQLGPEGLRHILAPLLEKSHPLEHLYLGGNRLGPAEAELLAELLRRSTNLRWLFLSVNRLGDAGIAVLNEGLRQNRSLEALGLASNGIGPSGAEALSNALRGHPRLELLDLGSQPSAQLLGEQHNQIGDAGALFFARELPDNHTWRSLNLSDNGITDEGGWALALALTRNTTLTRLNVGQGLSRACKQEIQHALDRHREAAPSDSDPPHLAVIRSVYRTGGSAVRSSSPELT